MKLLPLACATLAAAGIIFGCGGSGGSSSSDTGDLTATTTTAAGPSSYQFLNLSSDSTASWSVDGTVKSENVAVGGRYPTTDLTSLAPGSHDFSVIGTSGGTTSSVSKSIGIDSDNVLQFIAAGTPGAVGANAFQLIEFSDVKASLNIAKSFVRMINVVPGTPVDVYLTAPDGTITSIAPTVSGLQPYAATTPLITLLPGNFRIRATAKGTKEPVIADATITVPARRIGTFAVMPQVAGITVNAYLSSF